MQVKTVSYDAGDILFDAGMTARGIFIIQNGEAEVFRYSNEHRVPMARLKQGDIFGELAVISGQSHKRGVRAATGLDCMVISADSFRKSLNEASPEIKLVLRHLVSKLHRTNLVAYGKTK